MCWIKKLMKIDIEKSRKAIKTEKTKNTKKNWRKPMQKNGNCETKKETKKTKNRNKEQQRKNEKKTQWNLWKKQRKRKNKGKKKLLNTVRQTNKTDEK